VAIPKEILQQIHKLTVMLVDLSLCNHQNFPLLRNLSHGYCEINIRNHGDLSYALKNVSYSEIYTELERTHTYNLKMLDGALIQMMYLFKNDKIESHRLTFFSSPSLEKFQNDPEIYLEDEIYADVIAKNIVPFPFRFDFDADNPADIDHPKSHLTLGQYKNCRIPVTSPLMPYHFIVFILRNIYDTAFKKYSDKILFNAKNIFSETISPKEKELIYVHIPK
jgi:hypothetical protein